MNIVTDATGLVVMVSDGQPTPPEGGSVYALNHAQEASYLAVAQASPHGVVFARGGFTPAVQPLALQKVQKLAAVAAELARRNAAGFAYQGKTYQLDDASQARITSLAVKADRFLSGAVGATWGGQFIAADNSETTFTAAEFGAFAEAASNAVIERRLYARGLKNSIVAAADQAALNAIDPMAGWPV